MVAASRSETSAHKTFPVPVFCEKLSLPLAQATRFQTGPTNRTTGAPSSPSYTKLSPPSKGSSLGQRHTRCSQIAVKAKALSAQSTGVDAWPKAHKVFTDRRQSQGSLRTVHRGRCLARRTQLELFHVHRPVQACLSIPERTPRLFNSWPNAHGSHPIPRSGLPHWSLFQPSIPLVTSVGASLAATPSISQTLLSILPARKSSCDYFEPKLGDVVGCSRRRRTIEPITFLELVSRLLRPQR